MLKNILTIIIALTANIALAQKTFNIAIKLDSSIDAKKVQYQYYNGKMLTFGTDTIIGQTIIIKAKYYSPLASVNVNYYNGESYDADFFVSDKPAKVTLSFAPNNNNKLAFKALQNATPIFDTTVNKVWAQQTKYLTNPAFKQENETFENFMQQNKGFASNDSLKQIFKAYYKIHLNRLTDFIKQHPADYFCFWYFANQVNQVNRFLGEDKPYLQEQLAYVENTFPPKFTQSEEGKHLINSYQIALKTIQINQPAPPLNIITVDGKKLSLASLKGKYILLDFWATWCPPCMEEMPFIKDIRKKYPPEKLVIIGISADKNLKAMNQTIAKTGMSWLHYLDNERLVSDVYHVSAIPTLALIDKNGMLIYKTDFKKDDKKEIPLLLDAME